MMSLHLLTSLACQCSIMQLGSIVLSPLWMRLASERAP